MKTVLTPITRQKFGAPTPKILAHDEMARQHFIKYCDKCKVATRLKSWHEGPCTECYKNPYNMIVEN